MQPALGKTLFINQQPFLVTGVVEDYPTASHLRFNALVSMITLPSAGQSDWLANGYTTYLLLKKGADVAKVQRKIDQVTRKQLNPVYREQFGKSYEQSLREGNVLNYYLQPLLAVHLHSAGLLDIAPRGNILYVYLFSLVGLFLLLAVFNYINLTTAGGVQRAREVGVLKAMGATKKELTWQFLTESLLITALAAALAMTLCQLAVRGASGLLAAFLPPDLFSGQILLGVAVVTLLVGIGSGMVPALFLNRYEAVAVLKGVIARGTGGQRLRNILITCQFSVSIGLIAATLVVGRQMAYLQHKQLGFDREHLVVVANLDKLSGKHFRLKEALQRESSITSVSLHFNQIGTPSYVESIALPTEVPSRPIGSGSRHTWAMPTLLLRWG